jgi:hypothetical protein
MREANRAQRREANQRSELQLQQRLQRPQQAHLLEEINLRIRVVLIMSHGRQCAAVTVVEEGEVAGIDKMPTLGRASAAAKEATSLHTAPSRPRQRGQKDNRLPVAMEPRKRQQRHLESKHRRRRR